MELKASTDIRMSRPSMSLAVWVGLFFYCLADAFIHSNIQIVHVGSTVGDHGSEVQISKLFPVI